MRFKTLDEISDDVNRALVRLDLNVPFSEGRVTDTTRIERVIPTISKLLAKNIQIVMCSHFGRPEGKRQAEYSLKQIIPALEEVLGMRVSFIDDIGFPVPVNGSGLYLLENTRFYSGEITNDIEFAKKLATYGDVYVNDAFSASHRAHASIVAIAQLLPAYAGVALGQELSALRTGLEQPVRPVTAIVGGAKISTKIDLLSSLMEKVDNLIIGGGMANSFLAAKQFAVGKSLYEPEALNKANMILDKAAELDCNIILPIDVVVAYEFVANTRHEVMSVNRVPREAMIVDIGPETTKFIIEILAASETLIWNGPMGAFELKPFDKGTTEIAQWVAERTKNGRLLSIAGGGDTVYALSKAGAVDRFTYVSMAGGAFLEWMEGKTLPGIAALSK
ncbi:MAG: phosphoglycerate kinase [Alphaproteobacteria bacterium]|nr:phosphoglycerate kinase [Alphaproteobacteria bacterium]